MAELHGLRDEEAAGGLAAAGAGRRRCSGAAAGAHGPVAPGAAVRRSGGRPVAGSEAWRGGGCKMGVVQFLDQSYYGILCVLQEDLSVTKL